VTGKKKKEKRPKEKKKRKGREKGGMDTCRPRDIVHSYRAARRPSFIGETGEKGSPCGGKKKKGKGGEGHHPTAHPRPLFFNCRSETAISGLRPKKKPKKKKKKEKKKKKDRTLDPQQDTAEPHIFPLNCLSRRRTSTAPRQEKEKKKKSIQGGKKKKKEKKKKKKRRRRKKSSFGSRMALGFGEQGAGATGKGI